MEALWERSETRGFMSVAGRPMERHSGPEVVDGELAGVVAQGRALKADKRRLGRRQEVAEAEAPVGRRRGKQGRVMSGRGEEAVRLLLLLRVALVLVVLVLGAGERRSEHGRRAVSTGAVDDEGRVSVSDKERARTGRLVEADVSRAVAKEQKMKW